MKGASGLAIAGALAIVGALCNWLYLQQKSHDMEKIQFIGIADDVEINPGDKFKETDLISVAIPRSSLGNLEKVAYRWDIKETVVGTPASRSYLPGELILRQDLRTLPQRDIKKLLRDNERVMWIPVDTRSFVPALVAAGDLVSFVVPNYGGVFPQPAAGEAPNAAPGPSEILGPFRILALGDRLGTYDVQKASGAAVVQENVMAVAVKVDKGALDPLGQKLSDILRITNFQQVQVLLHPGEGKPK